jgi:predicted DNA-binding transcriptional regulator YafY
MKLTTTLKSLLTEIASIESIASAIRGKQVCVIYYEGDEPGGKGLRLIEPVCLGTTKGGNRAVRAYDIEGASHTGYLGKQILPGWRIFRLDKILSLNPSGEVFTNPREGFNVNGDKTFRGGVCIVKAEFDGSYNTPEDEINIT